MNRQFNQVITAGIIAPFIIAAAFYTQQAYAKSIQYVSDELTVPMRTGTSTSYRILSFLKSGAALEVLEENGDGSYLRVKAPDGTEGWIKSQYVMKQRSARDRIVDVNNQLDKSRDKIRELNEALAEQKSDNNILGNELADADKRVNKLEADQAYLKKISANPIAITNKNKVLQQNIDTLLNQNKQLKNEVERLSDKSAREWFILGAGVSLGSLLFGLLITRIRWQKKRSWGDL